MFYENSKAKINKFCSRVLIQLSKFVQELHDSRRAAINAKRPNGMGIESMKVDLERY
jgi:hypothetical protein